MMRKIAIAIVLISLCLGCAPKKNKPAQTKSYHFRYVQVPMQIPQEQHRAYLCDHYWDSFDFADTLWTTNADTTEMLRAYAAYVVNIVGPFDQQPISHLMQKASASRKMFDYFGMLSEKVLHDPNSPYRNDELYIAVLEAQISSPLYNKYEKMAPEYDLRVVSQNRIGRPANDFRYTTSTGRTGSLYGIKAKYTLIFFNNPGCTMCKTIREDICSSQLLTELISSGEIKVLALYPDELLDEWHAYKEHIPSNWINSYDKGTVIRNKNLYDLKAIPALYLLDSAKRVLIKDSTDVGYVEFVVANN